MASATVKKSCTKCSKGAGVATCDGCQQSLCTKHFIEHRQELSHKMESVGHEHDLLQRDLGQKTTDHPLFLQINTWERESVTKIQVTAEAARADLRELLDRNKKELKKPVTKIINELQSCREADDYTEIDINKWTQQLEALRKTLESPSTIHIDKNETPESIIRLISVYDQQQDRSPAYNAKSHQYLTFVNEKSPSSSSSETFHEVVGPAIVSEEGLVVTCTTSSLFSASFIYGANEYSSGTHRIHFRIENIEKHRIFLGISSFSDKMRTAGGHKQTRNGWWDLDTVIVNGKPQESKDDVVVKTGDEMILTLDCDNRKIQLQHLRTNRLVQQHIDLNKCPFSWKVAGILNMEGDSIRILY